MKTLFGILVIGFIIGTGVVLYMKSKKKVEKKGTSSGTTGSGSNGKKDLKNRV